MHVRATTLRASAVALLTCAVLLPITKDASAAVPPSEVWTWGQNADGQLGNGTTQHRLQPGVVEGLDDIVDIHGGREHVAALDTDGQVWTWGSNAEGQLGVGGNVDRSRPVAVPGMAGAVAVETGHNYTVALRADGSVWTTGLNSDGQLGDGTRTLRRTPVRVQGLTDAIAIAGGRNMTYAIRANGQLVGWGRNAEGQLGDGTTTARLAPVRIGTLTGVDRIAGGRDHGLAVLTDGSAWAWGHNGYGQIGDGSLTNRTAPVRIQPAGAVDVAAGAHHSYALRADGTVSSWGRNFRSALGDGTTTQRTRPVSVQGVTQAVSLAAGRDTGVVTLSDGRVQTWGHNASGQLGDGTTTDRASAIHVPGVSGATKAGGGGATYQVVLVGDPDAPEPPNVAPTAEIAAPICEGLTCQFSGSGSSDTDGTVVSWSWTFGVGQVSTDPEPEHSFPEAGEYVVSLRVTDDDGATGETSTQVTVADTDPGAVTPPDVVGSVSRNANTVAVTLPLPNGTAVGDLLVLVATTNSAATAEPGAGWTLVRTAADGADVTSWVWQRPAVAGSVRIVLNRQLKVSATLTAFAESGQPIDAVPQVTGAAAVSGHVSPAVTIDDAGSVVMRSWADKSSVSRTWNAPSGVEVLATSYGTGGGSIASLTTAEVAGVGTAPARIAASTAASNKAVSWSIVVPPQ